MNNITRDSRESWIDWAKTILMFFVVVGHAGLDYRGTQWAFIFAFHIPAFFLISGYLYRPHKWTATLKSFGIPVLFFSALNLLFFIALYKAKGDSIIVGEWITTMWRSFVFCEKNPLTLYVGVWFIITLFVCRLLMGDVERLAVIRYHSVWVLFLMIAYMVWEPLLPLKNQFESVIIYRVISCMPFLIIGYLLKQASMIEQWNREDCMCVGGEFFLISIIYYIGITLQTGFVSIWSNDYGGNYLVFIVNALVSSLILFIVCTKLPSNKVVVIFSKGTLLILGCHSIIITVCSTLYRTIGLTGFIRPYLTGFITLLICYYPIKFCIRYVPQLIGRNKK